MTLTAFLLARVAEDEVEIGTRIFGPDDSAGPNGMGWAEVGAISDVLLIKHARALAECRAKRRIVEDLALAETGGVEYERGFGLHAAARHLAAVYADHPDYHDDWRVGQESPTQSHLG